MFIEWTFCLVMCESASFLCAHAVLISYQLVWSGSRCDCFTEATFCSRNFRIFIETNCCGWLCILFERRRSCFLTVICCILWTQSSLIHCRSPWASAHRGKWGQLTPLENGWKISKRKHAKKSSFPYLCYILRAIRAGRYRERRYADHIFIQIYFRMHHFVVKFSSPQAARGHWPPPPTKILWTFLSLATATMTTVMFFSFLTDERQPPALWIFILLRSVKTLRQFSLLCRVVQRCVDFALKWNITFVLRIKRFPTLHTAFILYDCDFVGQNQWFKWKIWDEGEGVPFSAWAPKFQRESPAMRAAGPISCWCEWTFDATFACNKQLSS